MSVETQSVTASSCSLPVLRIGSLGEAVTLLQQLLESQGYRTSGVDGNFGPKTEQAVKKYQTNFGLVTDGIVGKKTWYKLGDRLINP
ncbi:MAG: peptidoglycan-binding protein [Rivularia sp. T60_A2020_040]|nr:peptidoglycan-binding protein [Rivularia sp. T60_A2020_040]